MQGCGRQQTNVVAPLEMLHQVIDEPGCGRATGDAILRWHQDIEPAARCDDLASLLEASQRVLDRNRRKITKVDVRGRAASERIRGEWGASTEKLWPVLARIAATDRLIDLIVYRLYGLTEEDVAVVEGE